jgi:hypothetical protein
VNKCDTDTSPPDSGFRVYQLGTLGYEMGQGCLDVGDRISNVVKALPMPLQEPPHRGIRSQRLQQLHIRTPDRDHRLLDPLLGDDLPIGGFDPIPGAIAINGLVQIVDGHGDVVEV